MITISIAVFQQRLECTFGNRIDDGWPPAPKEASVTIWKKVEVGVRTNHLRSLVNEKS